MNELERPAEVLEAILRLYWDEVRSRNGPTRKSDRLRGDFHGAKLMLVAVKGQWFTWRVLREVRRCTGLKLPPAHDRTGCTEITFGFDTIGTSL
jgi:hypothetical protein